MKKTTDSAFDSIRLELKQVDQKKTKRAPIILNKTFNSNIVSNSEETNILHIDDEPQGVEVDVTSFFVQFTTTHKKIDLSKYSKILIELDISADLVYNTHAKKSCRSVLQ